jgi:hypothetical protein
MMIKRIQLFSNQDLIAGWMQTLAAGTDAPLRAAACRVLHEVEGCAAPHVAITLEWFRDIEALRRYEARVSPQPAAIIAEEHILRGSEWLDRHWSDPTPKPKYKHMALARRAAGLSAAQFSERWRNRPGRIGVSTQIPAEARGLAYVQNHPIHESLYDAINEVYFDDLASMHSRIAFFAEHDVARADAELVSETFFAIVEEHLVA